MTLPTRWIFETWVERAEQIQEPALSANMATSFQILMQMLNWPAVFAPAFDDAVKYLAAGVVRGDKAVIPKQPGLIVSMIAAMTRDSRFHQHYSRVIEMRQKIVLHALGSPEQIHMAENIADFFDLLIPRLDAEPRPFNAMGTRMMAPKLRRKFRLIIRLTAVIRLPTYLSAF